MTSVEIGKLILKFIEKFFKIHIIQKQSWKRIIKLEDSHLLISKLIKNLQ